ncbi:sterol desaturase family protein [Limibacter armeniacum]|uniref:sterol desaturase family protein n=1 Tax=Limibacter armeniacum TaxID=466084 RepID=UPI002FE62FCE
MNVYIISAPIILGLLVIEIIYCFIKGNGYYKFQDTVANVGTAIGNQCVNLVVAAVIYQSFGYLFDNFAMWEIPTTWWSLAILLILIDFLFYWFHRVGHTINIFWAAHMPHHSSEEMNLGVGLRASVTQRLFAFSVFWPLPLLGFTPDAIYSMVALHLLGSYWHHTRVIKKLGWFEKWFNSPSHHRVHHGVNPQYIDKNFGEFLIIWDKMFGTFEPEVEEVCYGVTHPPKTWDPTNIYFQYWKELAIDAAKAPRFIDKIKIWFMPLGWRPKGMENEGETVAGIGYTLSEQVKFQTKQFRKSKPYLIFHIVLAMMFMYITVHTKSPLSETDRWIFSGAIFVMITAWGGILEGKKWAPIIEIFRLLLMAVLTAYAMDQLYHVSSPTGIPTLVVFSITAGSILWVSKYFREDKLELPDEEKVMNASGDNNVAIQSR